jgi:hypothetical protein
VLTVTVLRRYPLNLRPELERPVTSVGAFGAHDLGRFCDFMQLWRQPF